MPQMFSVSSIRRLVSLAFLSFFSSIGLADSSAQSALQDLQHGWAVANYQLKEEAQSDKFETLIATSTEYLARDPKNAELLIWDAILKSTYAGQAGGLQALGLVKAARKSLEASIEIDGTALKGSALTSLGTLYAQVPSWPVAFGSDKKARKYLEKALKINPNGIDPNYFYAQFLFDEGEYLKAKTAALVAQKATPRAGREIADVGRHAEIEVLLGEIAGKL